MKKTFKRIFNQILCHRLPLTHSENLLYRDICNIGSTFDRYKTINVIRKFRKHLWPINDLLYTQLSDQDRVTFINFFLCRHGGINVINDIERKHLDDLFAKALKLEKSKSGIDDYVTINFLNKEIKIITNKTPKSDDPASQLNLMACYNIVHAFYLNEYYHQDFIPEQGRVIFDCGASMGDTALAFSFQYDTEVHSFEYVSSSYELLKKNIHLNNLQSVVARQAFLHSKTGRFKVGSSTIETLAIDDYVETNHLNNIGMIKYDIEGGELDALNGSRRTILTNKPILVIPIYHLKSDLYDIPLFLHKLKLPMKFGLRWVERRFTGVDCVLFVRFT